MARSSLPFGECQKSDLLKLRMNGNHPCAGCGFQSLVTRWPALSARYYEAAYAFQFLNVGGIQLANFVKPHSGEQRD